MRGAAGLQGRPTVLPGSKTVKGKGVSFMEGDYGWHGKAPNAEQYALAHKELLAGLARRLEQAELDASEQTVSAMGLLDGKGEV